MPIQKTKLNNIDHLKTATKNISEVGHLTEKYGIQEKEAKPQKGATGSKKETTNTISKRRYLVRAVAYSPIFPGTTMWAYACSKLASAELLFERKRADGEFDVLELLDRQDRDERTGEYRVLRSTMVKNLPARTRHSW